MNSRPLVITGAGGGIGHTLVDDLLTRGYTNIACQYRSDSPGLRQVMAKHNKDFDAYCFQADLTDEVQVAELRHRAISTLGSVWGLINLAGASTNAMSWKMTLADFKKIIDANLTTTFLTCREFTPDMRAAGGGRIINTSSVVAATGTAGAAHYCAAKAGIIGFTRALAVELANKNVTANALALGYFETGLITHLSPALQQDIKDKTPLKRFGHVSEIAGLVDFLLGDAGAFTTGQVIHMNGGIHL
jgi:3-oxoacyl-[acyl-carrier protein] reductase